MASIQNVAPKMNKMAPKMICLYDWIADKNDKRNSFHGHPSQGHHSRGHHGHHTGGQDGWDHEEIFLIFWMYWIGAILLIFGAILLISNAILSIFGAISLIFGAILLIFGVMFWIDAILLFFLGHVLLIACV